MLHRDLVDAALVASAFVGCRQEVAKYFERFFVADKASGHGEYIGIVVLTGKFGNFRLPAQCTADSLVFVECHADALATAADGNAGVAFAAFHGFRAGMCEVGIVATVCGIRAEVLVGNTLFIEIGEDSLLRLETGMVAAHGHRSVAFKYCHCLVCCEFWI